MDSKTVKLNCLTLGELNEKKMSLFPKKKVVYPFKNNGFFIGNRFHYRNL